jgi:hypothetical protein
MSDMDTTRHLLLSFIGLLAERHACAPDEGFEYRLWDDIGRGAGQRRLVDDDEADEIAWLALETHSWVTYNDETGLFSLIGLDDWFRLLSKRGH